MGIATFASRIMGLVREQVFAFLFGAGNATDAFNIAFRIPNLLRDLFAEGAMSAALVPTFTRVRAKQGDRRAWRVAGLVFRVLFIFVSGLALVGIVFAPWLVDLYAHAYHSIPGKFELTVRMTQTMFPFFPLVALAAAFMGILNACGYFFLPAFASALFNGTSILVGVTCVWLFSRFPGWGMAPIQGMAIGVVAGGLVQAFCQLPSIIRSGYRFERTTADGAPYPAWYRDPDLKAMLWMMVPGTIGLAATQVNILVNSILATSQGAGAVSWLNYAFRLMQFPIGIFGVSLASATLPAVSRHWVERDLGAVSRTLSQSLKQVFAINLPASAGLGFLAYPIIELIFQYGRFSSQDTHHTAIALVTYSLGLTAYSAVKVLVPACYALGNTRAPVLSSVLSIAVTICLNLLLVKPFGYWGLALGTSIAAFLNSLFLMGAVRVLIRNAGGKFEILPLLRSFLVQLGISLLMGVICLGTYWLTLRWWNALEPNLVAGKMLLVLTRMFRLGVLILEGVVSVILLAKLFHVQETNETFDFMARKVRAKLSRFRSKKIDNS